MARDEQVDSDEKTAYALDLFRFSDPRWVAESLQSIRSIVPARLRIRRIHAEPRKKKKAEIC